MPQENTQRQTRQISNVRVGTVPTTGADEPVHDDDSTVRRFTQRQQAGTLRDNLLRKNSKTDRLPTEKDRGTANDPSFVSEFENTIAQREFVRRGRFEETSTSLTTKPKISRISRFFGIGILMSLYMWQLLIGILGLVIIITATGIETSFLSIFDVFGVSENLMAAGTMLIFLNLILAFATFFIFFILFYLQNIPVFNMSGKKIAACLSILFTALPGLNVIPWMLLWYLYIIKTSLSSST